MKGFELGLLVGSGIVLANYLIIGLAFPIRRIYQSHEEVIPQLLGSLGLILGFACWFVPMIITIEYLKWVFNNLPEMQRGSTNDGIYGFVLSVMWCVSFLYFGLWPIIKLAIEESKKDL